MGVQFDISASGAKRQIAWTDPEYDNAFLALDRNGDGIISDGSELFGGQAPQPASSQLNGWAALAVFDQPANGGNGDGIIDARDAIWSQLRLWTDRNHDGVSQPDELMLLGQAGVTAISLQYTWVGRRDQYQNLYRYRAKVFFGSDWEYAYDVFLQVENSASPIGKRVPVGLVSPVELSFSMPGRRSSCGERAISGGRMYRSLYDYQFFTSTAASKQTGTTTGSGDSQ